MLLRRQLGPREARYALTLGAGAVGTASPSPIGTIMQAGVQAGVAKATGGNASQVMKDAGAKAATAVVATAALAIPVVGPIISGIVSLVGPMLLKKKGLGSGCSPDEPALPGLASIRMLTDYQGEQYLAANPDVADYYKKCGAIWSASPAQYASWHWATFGAGKDGKSRTDPFTYPPISPNAGVPAGAGTAGITTQPSAADLNTFMLLQYQQQLAQAQAQAAQLKAQQDLAAAQLRAQAQITSASIAGQSTVQEAQAIAAGQAAQAQATAAAAQSESVAQAVKTAAALAQSRTLAATQAASAATASAERKQTSKWALVALVVAVGLATVGTAVVQRRRRRGGGLRLAHA